MNTDESRSSAPIPGLAGTVLTPANVTVAQRAQMYDLLASYFHNVTFAQFEHDLCEKDWVVLLCDCATGAVKGFSTLMQMRMTVDARPIVALFSGDTIIDRAYWGEAELPRIWGKHVFDFADTVTQTDADATVCWFLISSGYKTYRFLSVFFREFYPSCLAPTPPHIQRVLDTLGTAKFPGEYDPATGTIRFLHPAPLRAGVAEVTPRRLKDPHVAFFVAANPNHAQGEQLACLVEINRGNVTPAGQRMLDAGAL